MEIKVRVETPINDREKTMIDTQNAEYAHGIWPQIQLGKREFYSQKSGEILK